MGVPTINFLFDFNGKSISIIQIHNCNYVKLGPLAYGMTQISMRRLNISVTQNSKL